MTSVLALEWVQNYIGYLKEELQSLDESAGAISVAHQMVAYGGDNSFKRGSLFSAAIMQSIDV